MKTKWVLLLSLVMLGCSHTPEEHEVYRSLMYDHVKAKVLYVGKNWEIKDAVNANLISDSPSFHTERFWAHPQSEDLVAAFVVGPGGGATIVYTLEGFEKEFRRISG